MNKSTKIWLNYLIGSAISALLLWGLYVQITNQLEKVGRDAWFNTDSSAWLILAILLMPVNLGMEVYKWKLLAGSAQPISWTSAWKSFLCGVAFSIVTPNRVGEYPGRILYLKRKNTIRLIGVSFLGAFAQFLSLFIFGILGLIYYNIAYPGFWEKLVLIGSVFGTFALGLVFMRFEQWFKGLERIRWLRKFRTYGTLLKRFTTREQLVVLAISLIRFNVFTAQYLILLHWMKIDFNLLEGFCMGWLFFWANAVIPSIALAELGIRGQVGLFLFHHFSPDNTVGILAATFGLWFINLVIPAIIGSILLVRMRLLR